jgi:ribosome biogenesis GTPase
MTGRRLTRRQQARIAQRQLARAERASSRTSDDMESEDDLGPEQEGRVAASYGAQVDVLSPDGEQRRCHLRSNLGGVVAGDEVVFRGGPEGSVVVARRERRTELQRPDKTGRLRTIAANVDRVLMVLAPLPEPHANLIDRYLVAAENLGAETILLLNKTDLLADEKQIEALDRLLEPYPPLGYRVLRGAALDAPPPELATLLEGHTTIIVGQSGVGKSTLVNALLPDLEERTGELSAQAGKGRHTTTTARLLPLPGGGAIIDSPGIREFGLWHLDREAVERGFREFRDRIDACRFRDCHHEGEPGCALAAAEAEGRIHPQRLASYRHIVASLDDTPH